MFTDMVGYSKLTGDDQNLALELLKEHDKIIEPIIHRYNGEIVKRIGDAIVAFYGAPIEVDNHEKRACRTAIQMEKKLEGLRKKWKSEGSKWPKSR